MQKFLEQSQVQGENMQALGALYQVFFFFFFFSLSLGSHQNIMVWELLLAKSRAQFKSCCFIFMQIGTGGYFLLVLLF